MRFMRPWRSTGSFRCFFCVFLARDGVLYPRVALLLLRPKCRLEVSHTTMWYDEEEGVYVVQFIDVLGCKVVAILQVGKRRWGCGMWIKFGMDHGVVRELCI